MFQYAIAVLMVEAGKANLIETLSGDETALYLFETISGDRFTIARPTLSPQQEQKLLEMLRTIIQEENIW